MRGRVAFLITGLDVGGAETQLVHLATALVRRGWEVSVTSLRAPRAFTDLLTRGGVEVDWLGLRPGRPDPRALVRLIARLRRRRPHVLVNFLFHADLLGRLAGRAARVPGIVSSFRSCDIGGRNRERLLRLTRRLASSTAAVSHLVAEELARRGVVPPTGVHVIPNGLPAATDPFTPTARLVFREQLGLRPDDFVWLAVGRLEPPKDYPNLVAAFSRLAGAFPTAQVCIAGQGPLLEELSALAVRHEVGSRVRFLGLRDDVPQLLQAADGYVLSSAWEGLPMALLEAARAACPVVATKVGGVAEVIEHEVSGLLVPPGDPEALAGAMEQVMARSPEARRRLGEAARAQVLARFGMDQAVAQWERLFLGFVEQEHGAPRGAQPDVP